MNAPSFSTFSAISELFVTAAVFYVVLNNYWRKGFAWGLAAVVLVFEFSVNMLYMISRMDDTGESMASSKLMIAFAAGHGFLSLLVFILLVVYCFMALQSRRKDGYFFAEHKTLTMTFLGMWLVSVVSGEVLYVTRYMI